MNNLKLLFYLLSLISIYNITYLVIKIECIEYFSTIPGLVSYIVGMSFVYVALSNRIMSINKMCYLVYYILQILFTIGYLLYLQTKDECCGTRKVEVILYFCILYINLTIYGFLIYAIHKTKPNTFAAISTQENVV